MKKSGATLPALARKAGRLERVKAKFGAERPITSGFQGSRQKHGKLNSTKIKSGAQNEHRKQQTHEGRL
jgi:hypothetical protein